MGKTQLKKELATFSREQLEQMVLEAYSARKEIKAYFDFFLNPDVDKLEEKYMAVVQKELKRTRRGSLSRCRITLIKKAIREFSSFQPGFDREIEFAVKVVKAALHEEKYVYFTEAMFKSFALIVKQTIQLADRNMQAEMALSKFLTLLRSSAIGTQHFRRYLLQALEQGE